MKTYLFCLILVLTALDLKAQPYNNVIVPTDFANVNAFNIYKKGDNYIVSGIYYDNKSTIITIDNSLNNFEYYHFDSTSFSYRPFTFFGSYINVFSKNRFLAKGLEFFRLNDNFEISKVCDVTTLGISNFPTSSISIGQNILGSYDYTENNVSKMGVFCFGPDGLLRWNNIYEANIRNSIIWRLHTSRSNDLLASYAILYQSEFEAVARVMKIDTLGNELWKSDSLRGIFDVNSQVSIVELSDSSIFVTFKKDMHKDPDFFMKLHPYPPTYVWLDKDGRKVREQVLRISRDYEVYISEVKAGRGDYFYVYGGLRYFDTNDDYGFITKYANNGDTIWTHRYRHPAFDSNAYIYYVNDMVEEENGDLTVLGAIAPIAGKNEVWVFRVDSEGCYGTQTCDDLVLSTHADAGPAYGMTVYPNPTTGMLHISGLPPGDDVLIRLYSIDGRPVLSRRGQATELDISRLAPGIYLLQADTGTSSRTVKVMKR